MPHLARTERRRLALPASVVPGLFCDLVLLCFAAARPQSLLHSTDVVVNDTDADDERDDEEGEETETDTPDAESAQRRESEEWPEGFVGE